MGNTTSSAAELSIYISQLKDEAIDDTKENDKFWKQIIFQQSTPEIVFAAITPAASILPNEPVEAVEPLILLPVNSKSFVPVVVDELAAV